MIYNLGILTISDGCAHGLREDKSGPLMAGVLTASGFQVVRRQIVPDDAATISATLEAWSSGGLDIILTTGGTGLSPRDITPEATRRVIEREAPGIAELLRADGYQHNPRAVLSRGVAGICGSTLIVNLPGSVSAVSEGLDVLIPLLPHAAALLRNEPVDHTPDPYGSGPSIAPQDATLSGTADPEPFPEAPQISDTSSPPPTSVDVLETNIDDLSPEFYELIIGRLFTAGALDVFLTPIQMKKSRPGTLLTVVAAPDKTEDLASLLFRESSTFGIRRTRWERYVLDRAWVEVDTEYGPIRIKVGSWRGDVTSFAPEYEDVKVAAQSHNTPAKAVYAAAVQAYNNQSRS